VIPTKDNRSLLYRFQGKNRYNSFTYPDGAGWKFDGTHLHLSKIGSLKVKLHREIQGNCVFVVTLLPLMAIYQGKSPSRDQGNHQNSHDHI
jgi:hypothetical protein